VMQASLLSAQSEAELSFQRGQHYSNLYNNLHRAEDFELARASFQHALESDPKLARAAAEMALLYQFRFEAGAPPADIIPQMELWGHKAIEIDPKSDRAWAALGVLEQIRPQPSPHNALTYALRSVALGPRDTWSHNGLGIAMNQYSNVLAIAACREAARLDPLYLYPPLNVAEGLANLGRAGEALPPVEGVLRLEPDMPWAIALKASILIDLGRTQEAAEVAKQVDALLVQGRLHSEYRYITDGLNLDSGTSLHKLAMWAQPESDGGILGRAQVADGARPRSECNRNPGSPHIQRRTFL